MYDTSGTSSPVRRWLSSLAGTNPLVRESDRMLARLAVVLAGLALLAVPVVAAYGSTLYAGQLEKAQRQQQARFPVVAVLLEDAPAVDRTVPTQLRVPQRVDVLASWSAPGGAVREGTVPVTSGAKAGAKVDIWVHVDGGRVAAPMTVEQAAAGAVFATIGLWLAFGAGLTGVFWLMRARLTRARYAEWDREWQRIDGQRSG